MKVLLWITTMLSLAVNVNIAATAKQDLSLMLVQTLQNQLQTCMNQNADLVKRTCYARNKNPHLPGPWKRYPIAFHAGLSKHAENIPHNYKLVFDKVYLNEGKAYDNHTGVFTCPKDGIYVFHWTIETRHEKYFHTDFMVNGQVVGRSHLIAASMNRAASSTVVQRLQKGDKAWIEPHDNYIGQYAYAGWSFYSGYIL